MPDPLDPLLDPVEAYGRIALAYARISDQRRAYLEAVERLAIAAIPAGARSMLDIGAGDGARSLRIARDARVRDVVLLEPSAEMRKHWPSDVIAWVIRAEELSSRGGRFDAITCLWNVLGHIFPASARGEVLRQCARLLAPGGRIVIDVNHRNNVVHYGWLPTARRILRGASGDVTVTWKAEGIRTAGHVFTAREFAQLCRGAGLAIERRYVVDYSTGALRRWSFQGHLVYVLLK